MSSWSFLIPTSPRPSLYILSSLFTKELFSNKGLVSAFLLESMTSLAARVPSPLQNDISVQISMGTAEKQAGALLTFEGMRRKKMIRKYFTL